MHIAKFSVKNPVFVNLIMVTVFVLGTVALMDLPRQLMPNVNFHWVYVVTTYDGVSPEDIESLITIPLEEAVDKIDKIKMFTSSSSEGVSMISIQFENMKEDEYNKLYQDLKSEIDQVDDLPDEVDGPNYLEFGSDDLVPMLTMLISGTLPEREMKQIA